MSTFIDELERELRIATTRRVRLATALIPRPPAALVAMAVSGLVVAAVVAAALQLSGAKPPPPSRPPPSASGPPAALKLSRTQQKEEIYLEKALGTASERDPACAPAPRGGNPYRKPDLSQAAPSASLLATLGVLKRPAVASDRLPARKLGTSPDQRIYPNGMIPPVKGVYVRYIRRARWRFGAGYYIVPAENVNTLQPLPGRCYREQRAALRQALPNIPAKRRAGTLALEPRFLAYLRATTLPYPGVCLLALNATGNGDGGCRGYSTSQIEGGHTLTSGAPSGVPVVYGLAPDGVRSVTFYYKGRRAGHPLTVLVIDNVFILQNPGQRLPNEGFPDRIIWRAADGTIIKTITWK